ncbi:Redoxin [Scheffersomyces amazonensis]|uniref:Redoxin n=1 Tax=Scheffersomyces amazonensis TaxID=1078765 RepID=UPI00315D3701
MTMFTRASMNLTRVKVPITTRFSFRSISIGSTIPAATLFENSPGNPVDIAQEVSEGKSVIIGVPGAFSPACSASHIPGYLKNLRGFNDKGYDKFFIVAVNDAFVTKAWGDSLLTSVAGAQVKFLADPAGEFTKELDLSFDATKFFGNERSKRYALLVEDGKVTKTFVEPDNTSVDVSEAAKVLEEA